MQLLKEIDGYVSESLEDYRKGSTSLNYDVVFLNHFGYRIILLKCKKNMYGFYNCILFSYATAVSTLNVFKGIEDRSFLTFPQRPHRLY